MLLIAYDKWVDGSKMALKAFKYVLEGFITYLVVDIFSLQDFMFKILDRQLERLVNPALISNFATKFMLTLQSCKLLSVGFLLME